MPNDGNTREGDAVAMLGRVETRRYRDAATSNTLAGKAAKERGKEPRRSQSRATYKLDAAREALLGLTARDEPGGGGGQRIQLPQTYDGDDDDDDDDEVKFYSPSENDLTVDTPVSPKHRQPKENHFFQEQPPLVPPHDVYPPIQLVYPSTHMPTAPNSVAAHDDFDYQPPLTKQPSHNTSHMLQSHSPATRKKAEIIIGALAKGYLVRLLMQTDKAKILTQTIKDTQLLIEEFDSESSGPMTSQDREFLLSATSQLKRAKEQLGNIFLDSSSEYRVQLMRRQRGVEEEKFLRSGGIQTRSKTMDGSRLISDATKRFLKRKEEAAGRPHTAPVPAPDRFASVAPTQLVPSSPKHTDFLRRKTGASAVGKHSNAPIAPFMAQHPTPTKSKTGHVLHPPSPMMSPKHRSTGSGNQSPGRENLHKKSLNDTKIPKPIVKGKR